MESLPTWLKSSSVFFLEGGAVGNFWEIQEYLKIIISQFILVVNEDTLRIWYSFAKVCYVFTVQIQRSMK